MWRYYVKNLVIAAVGVAVASLVVWFLIEAESSILNNYPLVVPGSGMSLNFWVDDFSTGAFYGLVISATLAALWASGTLMDAGMGGSWTAWYVILWIVCAVPAGLILRLVIPILLSGEIYPALFLVLNNIVLFWIATVVTTPATHRYDPPASIILRRLLPF